MTTPASGLPEIDPAMPYMVEALQAAAASRQLREAGHAGAKVEAARLIRHKPGRRFMIEYDVVRDGLRFTLIGKSRAKGLDRHSYELQTALRAGAFGADATDGISIPATAGLVPRWNMWLQHKVEGPALTELLGTPAGLALSARAADAVHKLQRSGVNPRKVHGVPDELQILHERLCRVLDARPRLAPLISRVRDRCDRLAAALPMTWAAPAHRDFYPDHVLINRGRIYLIDFDLYAAADPHLDVGNFLAHVTEWSLRQLGDASALAECERTTAERFLSQAAGATRCALMTWKWLSLARHIYISTLFPDRAASTERLIELVLAADCTT
jgi:hypothetical protein